MTSERRDAPAAANKRAGVPETEDDLVHRLALDGVYDRPLDRVLPWDSLVGPGVIPCEEKCEVPDGVELIALPESRHAWAGIVNCPNGCGRSFEVRNA